MGIRTYPDMPRIYFDMDGVLADFDRACKTFNLPPEKLKLQKGAYKSLPIVVGAVEAVQFFSQMKYDLWVLTKCPKENPYSFWEKRMWLDAFFPEFGEQVIFTPDKGAVGKVQDYLIDDHPEWANARNFGGSIIKFEGSWDIVFERIVGLNR